MQETDKDIDELERLLGGATAEYRALRHTKALRAGSGVIRRSFHLRPYAVAASVLLLVSGSIVGLFNEAIWSGAKQSPVSRLAISRPATPLSLRPARGFPKRVSISRLKLAKGNLGPILPRRPTGSKG